MAQCLIGPAGKVSRLGRPDPFVVEYYSSPATAIAILSKITLQRSRRLKQIDPI